ncbi:MAG: DUF4430 domain-containing protein, partial [Clostridiales Family XIII bacterium]|nr:DUF4430 domain-containing protein [Clostridiales Family XIII bacterium]
MGTLFGWRRGIALPLALLLAATLVFIPPAASAFAAGAADASAPGASIASADDAAASGADTAAAFAAGAPIASAPGTAAAFAAGAAPASGGIAADPLAGAVSVRIEGNGMGIRGAASDIGTVLPETVVKLADIATGGGAVTALQAVNAALGPVGGVEYDIASFIVTMGGVAMPRDGSHYWAFYINDRSASTGLGTLEVQAGDRIVIYITSYDASYVESPLYSYFKVADIRFDNGSYPFATVRLGLYTTDWTGAIAPVTGAAVKYGSAYGPVSELTDSVNGRASFDIYPSAVGGDSSFDFYSDDPRFSRAFCRVTLTTDAAGQIVSAVSSQPVGSDTRLRSLTLAFPGLGEQSMLSSAGGPPVTVGNVAEATLSAAVNDPAAALTIRYRPANGQFGTIGGPAPSLSNVRIPLEDGSNTIELAVANGSDSEAIILTLVKGAGGDAARDAREAVDGVLASASMVSGSNFLTDWALGFAAAGKPLPQAAKDAFLTGILNSVPASPGSRAKNAIALSGLGIDARLIPDRANPGNVSNLVALAFANPSFGALSDAPYLLSLLDLDIYEFSPPFSRIDIINAILGAQNPDGSFGTNVDDTALLLPALSPYYKAAGANGVPAALCADVTAAIDRALAWISGEQLADGGFDGTYGRNSNTTAIVTIAVSALGIDAHSDPRFVKAGRSLIDHLLTFRAPGGGFGYASNAAYNDYATVQAFQSLVLWQNVAAKAPGNLYGFAERVTPYYDWPEADLLTSLILTPPAKLSYVVGEALDTAGMRVVAEYNGNPSKRVEIPLSACAISAPASFGSAGAVTVRVSYMSQSASFVVTVSSSGSGGGGGSDIKTVRISVSDDTGRLIASDPRMVVEPGATSVLDALKRLLNGAGKTFTMSGADYVSSIDGLSEFGKGPNSGWIFLINGVDPVISAADYTLSGGENVQWRYTLDYTKEPGSANFSGGGSGTPAPTSTSAALSPASGISAAISLTAQIGADGAASASLPLADVNKAIAGLREAQGLSGGRVAGATVAVRVSGAAVSLALSIPKESLSALSAGVSFLSIESAPGNALFGSAALGSLASRAADLAMSLAPAGVGAGAEGANADDPAGAGVATGASMVAGGGSATGAGVAAEGMNAGGAAAGGGTHPSLALSIRSGNQEIQSFGGPIIAGLHYSPAAGEATAKLCAYPAQADSPGAADAALAPILYSLFDSPTQLMRVICDGPVSFTIGSAGTPFEDISGHWAEAYIDFLAARGGVHGISSDAFAPGGSISRAQLVQML